MKLSKKCLVVILVLAVAGLLAEIPVFAEITGSDHDFSGETWNSGGEICIVCHTPHNAGNTLAPLWNHAVTSATFTTYSSPSLDATVGNPSASSKACLSCHDGTVAIDSFGGATGTNFVSGADLLGTDLANDHPVSFTYNAQLATDDGSLFDPTTTTVTALGRTIDEGMLIGSKVECGSCHDVHANKGDSATAGSLLLVDNAASALCLTCHDK